MSDTEWTQGTSGSLGGSAGREPGTDRPNIGVSTNYFGGNLRTLPPLTGSGRGPGSMSTSSTVILPPPRSHDRELLKDPVFSWVKAQHGHDWRSMMDEAHSLASTLISARSIHPRKLMGECFLTVCEGRQVDIPIDVLAESFVSEETDQRDPMGSENTAWMTQDDRLRIKHANESTLSKNMQKRLAMAVLERKASADLTDADLERVREVIRAMPSGSYAPGH